MAGDIDEAEHLAAGQRHVGITEVDRNSPQLLLFEPIGVDVGQLAHQRGLAVVDVAGGADDHSVLPDSIAETRSHGTKEDPGHANPPLLA